MTLTDLLERLAERERQDLACAMTLQALLERSAGALSRRGIDHAVLISVPSPCQSVMLPVLPIAPGMRRALATAVHAKAHPAAALGPITAKPTKVSRLDIAAADDPALAALREAFGEAGVCHVYELPLEACGDARVVLEVARVGLPIGVDLLSEIQHVMRSVPRKLQKLLATAPRHGAPALNRVVR